jgi:hypothetical protein
VEAWNNGKIKGEMGGMMEDWVKPIVPLFQYSKYSRILLFQRFIIPIFPIQGVL